MGVRKKVQGSGLRAQGSGLRAQGSGKRFSLKIQKSKLKIFPFTGTFRQIFFSINAYFFDLCLVP